jgi:hypothetical protein
MLYYTLFSFVALLLWSLDVLVWGEDVHASLTLFCIISPVVSSRGASARENANNACQRPLVPCLVGSQA